MSKEKEGRAVHAESGLGKGFSRGGGASGLRRGKKSVGHGRDKTRLRK